MPIGFRSLRHAFSLTAQSDIQTAVADGAITYQRGSIDFAPFGHEIMAYVSDSQHYGKAPWGSYREVLHRANTIKSQSRPASDLDLLWGLAFVMGGLSSAQPDALLLPNTYAHTLTFVDHATKPQMDYTSFLELLGDGSNPGYKQKLIGAWLNKVALSMEFGDFVKMQFDGGAREIATSTATMPTGVSTASLFKANITQIAFGNAGSEANVDGRWASFELEFNSNPTRVLRSGQPSSEEEFIHRVDRGMQSLTGSVVFELEDTAFRQKFLNATEVGMVITLRSDDTVDSNRKSCAITIPHIQISDEDKATIEESVSWKMGISEDSILEKSGNEPVTVVITTDIDDSEILTT